MLFPLVTETDDVRYKLGLRESNLGVYREFHRRQEHYREKEGEARQARERNTSKEGSFTGMQLE